MTTPELPRIGPSNAGFQPTRPDARSMDGALWLHEANARGGPYAAYKTPSGTTLYASHVPVPQRRVHPDGRSSPHFDGPRLKVWINESRRGVKYAKCVVPGVAKAYLYFGPKPMSPQPVPIPAHATPAPASTAEGELKAAASGDGKGVGWDELMAGLVQAGTTEDAVERALNDLMDEGKVYEPVLGRIQLA